MTVDHLPYITHRGNARTVPFVLDGNGQPVFLRKDGYPWKVQPREGHPALRTFRETR